MTARWPIGGHLGLSSPDQPMLAHLARSTKSLDQIDALADHGFAGVQDLFLKLRPPSEQAAMAANMARHGLALTSFGGDPMHWNSPLWSTEDAAARDAIKDSVTQSCAIAARFGGAGAVCVAGLDPARSRKAQLMAMTENLKHHAEMAARAGLLLLVEPIAESRIAGLLLNRLEDALDMVRAVGMPSVRMLFDIGHVAMMGHAVPEALDECADAIGLIQAADVPNRIDIGLGTLNWPAILAAVEAARYSGIIELEYEPVNPTAAGEAAMLARLGSILDLPEKRPKD